MAARQPEKSHEPTKGKRGPKQERLVIEGDWDVAVKQAIQKPKPKVPTKKGRAT